MLPARETSPFRILLPLLLGLFLPMDGLRAESKPLGVRIHASHPRPIHGKAYFAAESGRIIRVALDTFTIDMQTKVPGVNEIDLLAADEAGGFLYSFGEDRSRSQIDKLTLDGFRQVSSVRDSLRSHMRAESMLFDPRTRRLYIAFGWSSTPRNIGWGSGRMCTVGHPSPIEIMRSQPDTAEPADSLLLENLNDSFQGMALDRRRGSLIVLANGISSSKSRGLEVGLRSFKPKTKLPLIRPGNPTACAIHPESGQTYVIESLALNGPTNLVRLGPDYWAEASLDLQLKNAGTFGGYQLLILARTDTGYLLTTSGLGNSMVGVLVKIDLKNHALLNTLWFYHPGQAIPRCAVLDPKAEKLYVGLNGWWSGEGCIAKVDLKALAIDGYLAIPE